jgi:hypothetical protein
MSENNKLNPFYYSAPVIPPQNGMPDFDPFMDIPGPESLETRPGDLFRAPDGSSTTLKEVVKRPNDRRASKLDLREYFILK